jgi:hypothetical protein
MVSSASATLLLVQLPEQAHSMHDHQDVHQVLPSARCWHALPTHYTELNIPNKTCSKRHMPSM